MKYKFQFPAEEECDRYDWGFLYGLKSAGLKFDIIRNDPTLSTFPKISVVFHDKLLPTSVWTALRELEFREIK